jgi:hypothetical protein
LTFSKLVGWLIVAIHELIGGLRLRHVLNYKPSKEAAFRRVPRLPGKIIEGA